MNKQHLTEQGAGPDLREPASLHDKGIEKIVEESGVETSTLKSGTGVASFSAL